MEANAILEKLDSIGVAVTLDGEDIACRPGSLVPEELVLPILKCKPEIMLRLVQRKYELVYPDGICRDDELNEIEERVRKQGVVLLWSRVLEDLIAFVRDGYDTSLVPAGFTIYTESELATLFPDDAPVTSLRLIHEAKRSGGKVIGNEPDKRA